jgi:Co/Zn/Cd efflux system component
MDFFGDSVNYGASLLVVGMASVWSSRLALAKGTIMLAWGVFVMGKAAWMLGTGGVPESDTMTVLAILALAANVSVAFLLFRHREGDANRKAVWLCARNDAFGNIAVLVAAQGVAFTGRAWPDIVAATVLASLSLTSGLAVVRRARAELRSNG